jgi:hypothetical protein
MIERIKYFILLNIIKNLIFFNLNISRNFFFSNEILILENYLKILYIK